MKKSNLMPDYVWLWALCERIRVFQSLFSALLKGAFEKLVFFRHVIQDMLLYMLRNNYVLM